MGWNTTVVVMNDALSHIENDPDFGKKLAQAVREAFNGRAVDVPAGNFCNAATVIETHHADAHVLVRVGRNFGTVVEEDTDK